MSTIEAKYIATGSCCAQSLCIKHQLEDFDICLDQIPLKCDNTSTIYLTKNPIMHSKTKQIGYVAKGDCKIEYIDT